MALTKLLVCAISLALLSYGRPGGLERRNSNSSDLKGTCDKIAAAISSASQVFYPPSSEYSLDIYHPDASSIEASACSVEPGCVEDVSKILCILGSTRTPFAVKGGGHATNPGFSSTEGVHISMTRFNKTIYNSNSGTVEVGAGLSWDKVYTILESSGVSVVGGRTTGVGVAGFTLGGGYSFQTDQYGLTLDNVAGYELVLPNGTFTTVTSKDHDLWFGLRGGLNNFGIITKFILIAHHQTEVWGGVLSYAEDQLDALKQALINYQQKTDVLASLDVSPIYSSGQLSFTLDIFYDAPTQSGIFDEILAIPTINGTVSTRPLPDFISSTAAQSSFNNQRVFIDIVPVTNYSCALIDAFVNQTKFWGARLSALDKTVTVYTVLEPFPQSYFSHGSGSAWPPDRSLATFPSLVNFAWSDASLDGTVASALSQMSGTLRDAAVADGQPVAHASKYVNYALFSTPLEEIYGDNLDRLRKIRAAVDPNDVMGLAGGFKF